jgi:hypothetical protein
MQPIDRLNAIEAQINQNFLKVLAKMEIINYYFVHHALASTFSKN